LALWKHQTSSQQQLAQERWLLQVLLLVPQLLEQQGAWRGQKLVKEMMAEQWRKMGSGEQEQQEEVQQRQRQPHLLCVRPPSSSSSP
jgi:hypothetical protein